MVALIETILTVDSIEFTVFVVEKKSRTSTHRSSDLQIVERRDVHDYARLLHLQYNDKLRSFSSSQRANFDDMCRDFVRLSVVYTDIRESLRDVRTSCHG